MRDAAKDALGVYLDAVRATDAHSTAKGHMGTIRDEIDRVMNAVAWPVGDGFQHPNPGPDGTFPLGPGIWVWTPEGNRVALRVDGVLFNRGWTDAAGDGWSVQHSLHADGGGSVWLGVANNSARHDIDCRHFAESWKLWAAREAVPSDTEERGR